MAASSSNSSDNLSDPYYLHDGDSPGAILVSQAVLGDNYHSWSRSMRHGFECEEQNRLH